MLPHEFERFRADIELVDANIYPNAIAGRSLLFLLEECHDLATAAAHSVDLDVQIDTLKKRKLRLSTGTTAKTAKPTMIKDMGNQKLDGAILVQLSEYKTVPVKKKDDKDEGGKGKDEKDKQNDDKKKKATTTTKIAKTTPKKTMRRTANRRNLGDGDCMRIGTSII